MGKGEKCTILNQDLTPNKGDVVHPCVRFIPHGFRGHKWWMVYTPYYGADSKLENPLLCWGRSDDTTPPKIWEIEDEVVKEPSKGYNSDPYILYEDGHLNVYWRECDTERALSHGLHYATFVKVYTEKESYEVNNPILAESRKNFDREVSPALIKFKDKYLGYSMNLRFKNEHLNLKNKTINRILSKILLLTDLMGLYSQQKSYGISLWQNDKSTTTFNYIDTLKLHKCNILYRPWHLDMFCFQDKIYALIQSNQSNADIILAESSDGEKFTVFRKPLITNETINKLGIYKPTAEVVNNVFHLYYTAQAPENRKLNQLYVSSINFNELITSIK